MNKKVVPKCFRTVGGFVKKRIAWVTFAMAGLLYLPESADQPMENPYWSFSGPMGRVELGYFLYFNSLRVYSKDSVLLAAGLWDYGCDYGCIPVVGDDVFRSLDNGNSWSRVEDLEFQFIYAFSSLGSALFAGSKGGEVYRSLDAGISWDPVSDVMDVYSLYSMGDSVLFAGTSDSGVYRFVNTDSWVSLGDGLGNATIQSLQSIGSTLFAGTDSGVYRYSGDTLWVRSGLEGSQIHSLLSINSALLAGSNDGLYRSLDSGNSWDLPGDAFEAASVRILHSIDSVLFAVTGSAGVFRSQDNGNSWTQINEGLGSHYVYSLHSMDTVLFAGTVDGIYRADNALTTGSVGFKRIEAPAVMPKQGGYLLNGKKIPENSLQGNHMPVIRPNVIRESKETNE